MHRTTGSCTPLHVRLEGWKLDRRHLDFGSALVSAAFTHVQLTVLASHGARLSRTPYSYSPVTHAVRAKFGRSKGKLDVRWTWGARPSAPS